MGMNPKGWMGWQRSVEFDCTLWQILECGSGRGFDQQLNQMENPLQHAHTAPNNLSCTFSESVSSSSNSTHQSQHEELEFLHQITLLEAEIKALDCEVSQSREGERVKLVETLEVEVEYRKNTKEYTLTFHRHQDTKNNSNSFPAGTPFHLDSALKESNTPFVEWSIENLNLGEERLNNTDNSNIHKENQQRIHMTDHSTSPQDEPSTQSLSSPLLNIPTSFGPSLSDNIHFSTQQPHHTLEEDQQYRVEEIPSPIDTSLEEEYEAGREGVDTQDNLVESIEFADGELTAKERETDDLYERAINENTFLREQVITLIQQLELYKEELGKSRKVAEELEFRLNNASNRDFFKIKLSDLERKIQEKSLLYEHLSKSVAEAEKGLAMKKSPLPESTHLMEQIQEFKRKFEKMKQKDLARTEEEESKFHFYIEQLRQRDKQIEAKERVIEELAKSNSEYRQELEEERQTNMSFKNILQKLWEQKEELLLQLQSDSMDKDSASEHEASLNQDKQDIEQMNQLITSLTSQITSIKEELHHHQQQDIQNRKLLGENQVRLKEYKQELGVQKMTIGEYRAAGEKSEEYVEILMEEIAALRMELQWESEDGRRNMVVGGGRGTKETQESEPDGDSDSDRSQRSIFLRNLETKPFHLQTIQKLVEVANCCNSEVETLTLQNKQLKNLLLQYSEIAKDNSQGEDLSVVNLNKNDVMAILSQNNRLEKELSLTTESNIDLNLFEQVVNELEKSKQLNVDLKDKLDRASKELITYQREIFEKAEAINYLNLALIRVSGEINTDTNLSKKSHQKDLSAELRGCKAQLMSSLDANKHLETLRCHEIQTLAQENHRLNKVVLPGLSAEIRELKSCLSMVQRSLGTPSQTQYQSKYKPKTHTRTQPRLL